MPDNRIALLRQAAALADATVSAVQPDQRSPRTYKVHTHPARHSAKPQITATGNPPNRSTPNQH